MYLEEANTPIVGAKYVVREGLGIIQWMTIKKLLSKNV